MFKKAGLDEVITRAIEFPSIVEAAREWAKDCQWGETEVDEVNEFINGIEPRKLLKLVDRHYDGGLPQLIKDNVMEKTSKTKNNRVADVGGAWRSQESISPVRDLQDREKYNQFNQTQIPEFIRLIGIKRTQNLNDNTFYYFAKGLYDENFANSLMAYYKANPNITNSSSVSTTPGTGVVPR